jgi:uncharacterized membrane protein YdjX (TVP38/TMEM64 family)
VTSGSKSLSTGDKIRLVAPVVIYAILAFVAWKLGYFREQTVEEAARSTGSVWVGGAFALIYGAVGALALPLTPLAFVAGAVFGFWRASFLVWIGSMLAAVTGYYLARGVWAKPARRLLGRHEGKLHDLRTRSIFLTSLRVRLVPLIPFGVFSFAAGISKISLLPFLIGTGFGVIPTTLLTAFVGDRFAAGFHGESKTPYFFAAAAALVMLALSFAPKLWGKFKGRRRH